MIQVLEEEDVQQDMHWATVYIMINTKENISLCLYTNSIPWQHEVQFPFKLLHKGLRVFS